VRIDGIVHPKNHRAARAGTDNLAIQSGFAYSRQNQSKKECQPKHSQKNKTFFSLKKFLISFFSFIFYSCFNCFN